jgi:hypothetical protein
MTLMSAVGRNSPFKLRRVVVFGSAQFAAEMFNSLSLMFASSQKCLGSPASLRAPFAVCVLRSLRGTVKRRLLIGLSQISWSPFP